MENISISQFFTQYLTTYFEISGCIWRCRLTSLCTNIPPCLKVFQSDSSGCFLLFLCIISSTKKSSLLLTIILKHLVFTQPVFVHQQTGCTLQEITSTIASSQKLPAQPHFVGGKEPHTAAWWPGDVTLTFCSASLPSSPWCCLQSRLLGVGGRVPPHVPRNMSSTLMAGWAFLWLPSGEKKYQSSSKKHT